MKKTPSQDVFDVVWSLLREVEIEPLQEEYLPYLRDHFAQWPVGLRGVTHEEQGPLFGEDEHDENLIALLSLIDTLNLSEDSMLTPERVAQLARHPQLEHIKSLNMNMDWWEESHIESFAKIEGLKHVERVSFELALSEGDEFSTLFGNAVWAKNLTHLRLNAWYFDEVDDDMMEHIMSPRLEMLHITYSHEGSAEVLGKISQVRTWEHLQTINISGEPHTHDEYEPGYTTSLCPENLPALHSLSLRNLGFSQCEHVLEQLDRGPLPCLSSLSLSHAKMSSENHEKLWSHELISHLTSLEFSHIENDLMGGSSWLKHLETSNFSQLQALYLSGTRLTNEGISRLVKNTTLHNVSVVHVQDCKVTASGILELVQAPWSLSELNISGNPIEPSAWAEVVEALKDTQIRTIFASGTDISDEHALALSSLSGLEELTFLPGNMSLHGIADLCFSSTLEDEVREKVRAHALLYSLEKDEACDDDDKRYFLLDILQNISDEEVEVEERTTNAQILHTILAKTAHRETFALALCTEEYLEHLTKKQLIATLQRWERPTPSSMKKSQAMEELEHMLEENDHVF